tara:strand:+ start:2750 stop:3667 length:918 start_codon:yes stop_codon:yes gene_type:complete
MKNLNLTSFISLLLVMSFYRCDKQSDEFITDLDTTSFVEAFLAFAFDQDVEELVDDAFALESYSSKASDISLLSISAKGPKRNFKGNRYGKCATITVDEENNIKTVFFDGECFGKRGQTRTGTIVISYSETKGEIGSFRQVEFDNYFLNDVQIEGVRRYEITGLEERVNRTVQMTLENGKMTYPDGSFSTKSKSIIKYITYEDEERVSTSVTGNASGVNSDGTAYEMEITSPILFIRACAKELMHKKGKIPVSGVKRILKGESEMIINYGDGECDFTAEVTKDGVTETIDLKEIKRKRKFRKLKS